MSATGKPSVAHLTELQELAEKATPGPWCYMATGEKDNSWALGTAEWPDGTPVRASDGEVGDQENERWDEEAGEGDQAVVVELIAEHYGVSNTFADAAFIAAADPGTVLALIRAVQAAQAYVAADTADDAALHALVNGPLVEARQDAQRETARLLDEANVALRAALAPFSETPESAEHKPLGAEGGQP